jgi:hypothetical protein
MPWNELAIYPVWGGWYVLTIDLRLFLYYAILR